MPIKRITMKFLVPVKISGIKSETLNGRKLIPCYISPQSFRINESKLITETMTKGGYMVEYWGEALPSIQVDGLTGSGGIEAIEILRSIYRNEQIQMEQVLRQRARVFEAEAAAALQNSSSSTLGTGIVSALDSLFENGFSEILNGVKSTVEEITDIFEDSVEEDTNPVTLIPSLGAFAVSVDLYMQGVKYRGFFKEFNVDESADSPGLFNYSFTFSVLRRVGQRKNFMPWHRNPYDANGNAVEASTPLQGAQIEELSYPSNINTTNSVVSFDIINQFVDTPSTKADTNDVGISRFEQAKK